MFFGLDLADSDLARVGVALAVAVAGVIVGKLVAAVLRRPLTARRTPSFGRVVSRLVGWTIGALAIVAAVTIVFPSVKPVDFIAGLGIFSIALGFAFQDILSNLLAGLLLIIRQPFQQDDQIEVNGHLGVVEGITIRETTLRTFKGERIIIPNADVYQSALRVQTAFDQRRTDLVIGVGYDDDLDQAEQAILEACASVDGVADDPEPQAYLTDLGDNAVNFDLRFWTAPDQATVRRTQHLVLKAVKKRLDAEGIDMPYPVRTLDVGSSFLDAVRPSGSGAGDQRSTDLVDLSKDELYAVARKRDVDGRSTMDRDELLAAITTPTT